MSGLASLDGPVRRGYGYREPLGTLGCACDVSSKGKGSFPIVKRFTTDLAISKKGLTDFKKVLDEKAIPYTPVGNDVVLNTKQGAITVPALLPNAQVAPLVTNLQSNIAPAATTTTSTEATEVSSMTPTQKKWAAGLLTLGGLWLAYEIFKPKNPIKSLSGPEPVQKRKLLATARI